MPRRLALIGAHGMLARKVRETAPAEFLLSSYDLMADFLYKATRYYAPQSERAIIWNDPELAIAWPLQGEPTLSGKDAVVLRLVDADIR